MEVISNDKKKYKFLTFIAIQILVFGFAISSAYGSPIIEITNEIFAPSSSTSCTGQGAAFNTTRSLVDAQRDNWESIASSNGLTNIGELKFDPLLYGIDNATNPMITSTPIASNNNGVALTVAISARDVDPNTIPGYGGSVGNTSIGALSPSGAFRRPYLPNSGTPPVTLQDCAPYPLSLMDTDSITAGLQPEPYWNALSGSGSHIDGVLFDFSRPIRAFGGWFGDLETRPGTTPAYIKVFNGSTIIYEGVIGTSTSPINDTTCGGSSSTSDANGCGNSGTRWIGFVLPSGEQATSMLVTVGDDDSCVQVPASCDAATENLSFMGATAILSASELTIEKATTAGNLAPGETFDYTIDIENLGDVDATNISVSDIAPSGITFNSASGPGWSCAIAASSNLSCSRSVGFVGALPTITVNASVGAQSNGTITNTASATWDLAPGPIQDSADVNVTTTTTTTTMPVTTSTSITAPPTTTPTSVEHFAISNMLPTTGLSSQFLLFGIMFLVVGLVLMQKHKFNSDIFQG